MKGSIPFLNSRTRSPFLAASMAHQTTTATRASSDGWKPIEPSWIQRRAPFTVGAISRVKGSTGMRSSTTVTSSSGHARWRHR